MRQIVPITNERVIRRQLGQFQEMEYIRKRADMLMMGQWGGCCLQDGSKRGRTWYTRTERRKVSKMWVHLHILQVGAELEGWPRSRRGTSVLAALLG